MSLHKSLLRKLLITCALMFAFSFALVPLYTVICKVTGVNGKTSNVAAVAATSIDSEHLVGVEFLAKTDQSVPWEFSPEVAKVALHPGEVKVVNFNVKNMSNETVIAQAVPSVSPGEAAQYFKKMECFCFTRQSLSAGEAKAMRLQFYLDPALPKNIPTVTLSYTLYRVTN